MQEKQDKSSQREIKSKPPIQDFTMYLGETRDGKKQATWYSSMDLKTPVDSSQNIVARQ